MVFVLPVRAREAKRVSVLRGFGREGISISWLGIDGGDVGVGAAVGRSRRRSWASGCSWSLMSLFRLLRNSAARRGGMGAGACEMRPAAWDGEARNHLLGR